MAYSDGTMLYGSRVLGITGSGNQWSSSFVAENVEITRPTILIKQYNQVNQPLKQESIDDFVMGTATIQMISASNLIPTPGATFQANFTGSVETFWLNETGQPESQGEVKKVRINFNKKYN